MFCAFGISVGLIFQGKIAAFNQRCDTLKIDICIKTIVIGHIFCAVMDGTGIAARVFDCAVGNRKIPLIVKRIICVQIVCFTVSNTVFGTSHCFYKTKSGISIRSIV